MKCSEVEEQERRGKQIDSAAVSIFVVILVELTNTVFVNSTNIATYIDTAVLSRSGRTYDCPPQEACAYY